MANLSGIKFNYFILSVPNDEKLYTISRSNVMTRWHNIASKYLHRSSDETIKLPIDVLKQMGCFQLNYNLLNPVKRELTQKELDLRISLDKFDESLLDMLYTVSMKGMFFDLDALPTEVSRFNSVLELAKSIISFGHLPGSNMLSFIDSRIMIHCFTFKENPVNVLYIKFN